MSMEAVIFAQDHSRTTSPAARAVLMAIARSADQKTGEAFLSVETLCKRTCYSRRPVQYALRELEELGEVHCNLMYGRGGVNLYTVNIPPDQENRAQKNSKGRSNSAPGCHINRVNPAPPASIQHGRGVNPAPQGASIQHRGGAGLAPREVSLERNQGEVCVEGSVADGPAAEPHTGEVAASDAGLRPSQAAAAATGAGAPGLFEGAVPPLTPFRALALDAAETAAWSRILRRSQAAAFNGSVLEWAEMAMDAGAQTWDDAGAAVREFVRLAKMDQPKAKPYLPSEVSAYANQVRGMLLRRRRATTAPSAGSESTAARPSRPQEVPAAAPMRKDPEAERDRRRAGQLNALEQNGIDRGLWLLREDGELVRPDGTPLNKK